MLYALGVDASAQDVHKVEERHFPFSVQFSPVPSGKGWRDSNQVLTDSVKRETIHNFIQHGVTHIATGAYNGKDDDVSSVLDYAQSLGMKVDYLTHGVEQFGREVPPEDCIFSPGYAASVRASIEPALGGVRDIANPYSIFPFMDEPFHMDTTSFDYRTPAKDAFASEYGYPMPSSFSEAAKDPRKYMDFINFQSSTFSRAWRQVYDEVKKLDSRPMVTITHDSHNTFGAGAGSNSVWACDDVFHWGADFADMFIYDIYPYTCEDYRVGESGLVFKPRMSQFHWTLAQMRNLTETYGKTMGFWVGSFNPKWFSRFMDENRRSQFWMEREMAYTAIAGGSDFIITGINVPIDAHHWDDLGEGMATVQKCGGDLLDAKRVKSKACFLFPRTQHVLTNREYFNVALTFELCLRAFGEMDVIHEEQITDDSLDGYEALVLADVEILPEAVAGRIKEFVRKGGTVIADCVPQKDEALDPSRTLSEVFGVESASTDRVLQEGLWIPATTNAEPGWMFVNDWKSPAKTFDQASGFKVVSPRHLVPSRKSSGVLSAKAKVVSRMASGEPLLMKSRYGKGKAFLFGFCLQDTYLQSFIDEDEEGRDVLQALVRKVFLESGAKASTYSTNPDVEVALRKGDSQAFALIINHEAQDPASTVTLSGLGFKPKRVIDVQTGEPVPFKKSRNGISLKVCPSKDSAGGVTRLLKIDIAE